MQTSKAKLSKAINLIPVFAVLALAACASNSGSQRTAPFTELGNNPVFAEPLVKSSDQLAPRDLATMIFLRPGNAASKSEDAPLNVYVNGRYLASLLPGGYVEHRNCAGQVPVAAVFDDARIRHLGQRGQEISLPIEAGKTYYFKTETTGDDKQAHIVPLTTNEVFLGEYRRQAHAITRAPNCLVAAAAPAAPVAAAAPAAASTVVVAAPIVSSVSGNAAERVAPPLEGWRAAWERGDYAAYTSFYAPDFKGTLSSRNAWEAQRRARLNNTAKKIGVNDLAVSTEGAMVLTDFRQSYESKGFDDNGQKRLVWKDVGGELKIVTESFTAAKK